MQAFQAEKIFEVSSFVELLHKYAQKIGERDIYHFIQDGDNNRVSLNYASLEHKARAIGASLQQMQAKGERVLLLFPVGLEYIEAFWGCLYAGSIAVPAYPPSSSRLLPRLQAIIEDAGARIALTTTTVYRKIQSFASRSLALPAMQWVMLDELPEGKETEWQVPNVGRETVAFLQYTSGSTSVPKGVMVTHGNLLHNSWLIHQAFQTTPDDHGVIWLPPYHDMGLIGGLLQPLVIGFPVTFLSPIDFIQRPMRWLEQISRVHATVSGAPNFAYELVVEKSTPEQRVGLDLRSWRLAFTGAEPIRKKTLERFSSAFVDAGFRTKAFFTCYGLAENTLIVTGKRFSPPRAFSSADLQKNRVTPLDNSEPSEGASYLVGCGQAVGDQQVRIVDPETRRFCTENTVGEIWIRGSSVGRGYWGRQEQTAETFQACLATGEEPFLRSGDLGFWYQGDLYVTGRIKDLIIIRGRNYYPQDIELTAECSHPALCKGANAAFSLEIEGEERLFLAQEVERHQQNLAIEEVAGALRQAVMQEHGVRLYGILLLRYASIPKTSSGKIQRHACRDGYLHGRLAILGSDMQAYSPENDDGYLSFLKGTPSRRELLALPEKERQDLLHAYLVQQIAHLLRLSPLQVERASSPGSLGLDSLAALQCQRAIETDFEVAIEPALFLEGSSLAELVAQISARLDEQPTARPSAFLVEPLESEQTYPMSYGQQGLWFLQKFAPDTTAYHIARAFTLAGEVDLESLRCAFEQLVERHQILHTAFFEHEGQLLQRVQKETTFFFVEDAAMWSEERLEARQQEEVARPLNLEAGQPMRILLLLRAEQAPVLLWVFHHLVIDFWSFDVLLSDLAELYRAARRGKKPQLPPPGPSYIEYTLWQRRTLQSEEGERDLAYWRERLWGELPLLDLPTDHPRPLQQSFHGATIQVRLSHNLTRALHKLAHSQSITLSTVLLTVYAFLLHSYSGQEEVIIGSYMAGRTRTEFDRLVGYLVNAVPQRISFSDTTTFINALTRVREVALGAFTHQGYPFDLLVKALQVKRAADRSPLFQAAFVSQNVGEYRRYLAPIALACKDASVVLDNLTLHVRPLEERVSLFDLSLTVAEVDDELVANFQYNTALFEATTIMRLVECWRMLLERLSAFPSAQLARVSLLTEKEQQHLAAWTAPRATFPVERTLPQLFEARVVEYGQATAVVYEQEKLTYAELNRRANQLAHYLQKRGVGPDVLVGISMERSPDLIVGILGICKAGGAYIPLDPAYPVRRLAYLQEDSRVRIVLTQECFLEKFLDQIEIICMDRDRELLEQMDNTNPVTKLAPDHLAYVIYTSGSSGNPKGVMVSHCNVVRLFQATWQLFQFNATDVWTLFHSYAFDFSVWEIWGALLYGGRLVVVPYMVSRSPSDFYRLLIDEQVTILNQTPSAFRQLLRVDERFSNPQALALRYIIFGGEALDMQSVWPWFERHGDQKPRLVNMYGITETTVHVTYRPLCREDVGRQGSVIGRAISDLEVYVLDQHLQQVPVGVRGEVFVGGAGVARGYLNRPELNAERFLEIAGLHAGTRFYRTGDLARYLPDGEIEYLGRIDHQVKIRGFRIELGEIEALLAQHPQVREHLVLVREDRPGDKKLVAYLVARDPATPPEVTNLRAFLAENIPDYMVPSAFVVLEAFPLTTNGKVDRAALPTPGIFSMERAVYTAPSTPEERTLVSIWERVLEVCPVGIDDNFFLLGGDSIRSISVSSLAREQGIDLTLEQIFRYQTIRELGRILTRYECEEEAWQIAPYALIAAEDRLRLPADIQDAYPVPAIQMSYYFHSEASIVYKAYLGTYRVRGPFHEEIFNEVFRRMVRRHEILRTSFDLSNYSIPLQLVHQTAMIALHVVDLRHLGPSEQEQSIEEFIYQEERTRFNWQQPGLVRFHTHRLTDDIFQFTMCEPLLDGWSAATTMTEVLSQYLQLLKDPAAPELPALRARFNRFVEMERRTQEDPVAQAFWERMLNDVSTTRLPRWKASGGAMFDFERNDRLLVSVEREVTEGLFRLSRSASVPLKDILLAAHLKLVSLFSGQTDVVTGVVTGGRPDEIDAEQVLGAMVNTMPFRLDIVGGTWEDLVRKVFEVERSSYPYRRFPLVDLQKKYSGGQRLFETIFNYTHFHIYRQITTNDAIEVLDGWHRESAYVPLTIQFSIDPATEQLLCVLDYYPENLCRRQVAWIGDSLVKILKALAWHPTLLHQNECLLGDEEYQRLVIEGNHPHIHYPLSSCFHQLFARQAARSPSRQAIVHQELAISYEELEYHSNRLANFLHAKGVQPGTLIGYFGERTIDWGVAVLAIFKVGAIYLPLDPRYPVERLRYMFEHAGMRLLLTYTCMLEKVSARGHLQVVCLDRDAGMIEQASPAPPPVSVAPDDLAYVIYTSGSTGQPKGVMIEQKGMLNHLYAKRDVLGATEQDIIAQNASHCFDVSIWQLLLALLSGGRTVILPDEAEAEPKLLLQEIEHAGVTIFETVPTVLQSLLEIVALDEDVRPSLTRLRWLVVSGELLAPELCRQWFRFYPHIPMINSCGATEASDDVTHEYIREAPGPDETFMPIGKVIPNSALYILDQAMMPVPTGVPGELYYGGVCVGRGYLNDSEKTNLAFKNDPFAAQPEARLYKTGDLVRCYNDGSIEFLGRVDQQVKIRGFRIEPGEVEAVLNKHPLVRQVVATAHTDAQGNKRLISYLTVAPDMALTHAELRIYMKREVPDYLIPSLFIILDEFPLMLNGKIDRKRLPAPDFGQGEAASVSPGNDLEHRVATLWGNVLGYAPVSMTDDFFARGGDSLLATRLVALIRKEFSIELPLRSLFEVTTVAGLAEVVRSQSEFLHDAELAQLLVELEGLPLDEARSLLNDGEIAQ
jgi:amino acid adenylation domain-containing protein